MEEYISKYTGEQIDEAVGKTLSVDETLTKEGYPADAKAVGDKLKNLTTSGTSGISIVRGDLV